MIGAFKSRQFVMFLVTGGLAAAVNFGSRILYNQWMGFSAAIVLAYITGMVTAFVLARIFVFQDSQRALHQSALYFVLVNLVAVAQTWIISLLLADYVLPSLGVQPDQQPQIQAGDQRKTDQGALQLHGWLMDLNDRCLCPR